MSTSNENDHRLYTQSNTSTASLSATPSAGVLLHRRTRPPDVSFDRRRRVKTQSPVTSIGSGARSSPLWMQSARNSPLESPKLDTRRSKRRSRQSLSCINNNSTPSADGTEKSDIASKVSQSLSREKMAWSVINREIAEWQSVCHTGRPSWWSPGSRWTRRLRSQSSMNREMTNFGGSQWVDDPDDMYYPGLCFGNAKDAAIDSAKEESQELAFLIAVQLLGACFTLPVEEFSTRRSQVTFDSSPEFPDSRLISSLRMHTSYRWSPAFGHEQRTTSPEYPISNTDDLTLRYTPGLTEGSPDIEDSGTQKGKRKRHRARHVTPAETTDQERWEEAFGNAYEQLPAPALETPTLGTLNSRRRNLQGGVRHLQVPGRVVRSAPQTPLRPYRALPLASHVVHRDTRTREEYPFPITGMPDELINRGRFTLQPHLRSEPHPVFVQPVKELVVKRWRTFKRRFGNSLSHGNPDMGMTTATFTEEYTTSTWAPATPPVAGIRRRRDARSRHDIHSSSMESSPRYNTPNSGTQSGMTSPGLQCAPPGNTPVEDVDDLLATARAITNTTSQLPQEPLTADQPFPVFTPNNTPEPSMESSPALPRTEAGCFTPPAAPGRSRGFLPRSSGHGSGRRNERSRRSRLSEVFTPDDTTEQIMQRDAAANRRFLETGGSALSTPTEESGESDSSRKSSIIPSPTDSRRRTFVEAPRDLCMLRGEQYKTRALQRSHSFSVPEAPSALPISGSTIVLDPYPFGFLVPRRESTPQPPHTPHASGPAAGPTGEFARRGNSASTVSRISSNDDLYDPHEVDCHSNLPKARQNSSGTQLICDRFTSERRSLDLDVTSKPALRARTEPIPSKTGIRTRPRSKSSPRPQRERRTQSTPIIGEGFEEELKVGLGRNRLERVSSSGTTIMRTGEDGVEVQGVPAGPERERWDVFVVVARGRVERGVDRLRGEARDKRVGSRRRARSFL